MLRQYKIISDRPLTSVDLDICQRAFDAALFELNIDRASEEAERVAAIIIALFQKGVCDERHLTALVSVARGRLYHTAL